MTPKTVVVTGGAGLVGSCLCARLLSLGHKVISLDNYFTGSPQAHIAGVDYREGHSKNIEKHITESPNLLYHLGEYHRNAPRSQRQSNGRKIRRHQVTSVRVAC